MSLLKRGLAGEPVKWLRARLGVTSDGEFGPETEKALRKYQEDNDLEPDGIAGPITFAHLKLYERQLRRKMLKAKFAKPLYELRILLMVAVEGDNCLEQIAELEA